MVRNDDPRAQCAAVDLPNLEWAIAAPPSEMIVDAGAGRDVDVDSNGSDGACGETLDGVGCGRKWSGWSLEAAGRTQERRR